MTCAKQTVSCSLWSRRGSIVYAENACDHPQAVCPRAPGEGYEKCASVCGQRGHAEIQALTRAADLGIDLRGARAYVTGHYYVCEPCARALRDAGVEHIDIQVHPTHTSLKVPT